MAPPPHPFRVLDFYRDSKTEGLGVAWNADLRLTDTGRYMRAVDPDDGPGAINLASIDEYFEMRFGSDAKARSKAMDSFFVDLGFAEPEDAPYPLPDKPEMPLKEWEAAEGMSLLDAHAQFFGEHVRFPSDDTSVPATTVASWTLATYIPEVAAHAPSLAFIGLPGSGKSRALRELKLTARKAMYLGAPSVASLYALIDHYQPTLLIDEWTKVTEDLQRGIEQILRIGFDPDGRITRRRERSEGVRHWRAFAFFAVGSQTVLAQDVMERAFPQYMREARGVPRLSLNNETARDLRTASLRFRLEVLAGKCHRTLAVDVEARVRDALHANPAVALSDRGVDKSETLARFAIPFDHFDDVFEAAVQAQREAGVLAGFSIEAYVVQAVLTLLPQQPNVEGKVQASLTEIHDEVWGLLTADGMSRRQLENADPVIAEKLGPMCRTLGLHVERFGKKGARHVIEDASGIVEKLKALSRKFGGSVVADDGKDVEDRGDRGARP
jgi:hypothetical protein